MDTGGACLGKGTARVLVCRVLYGSGEEERGRGRREGGVIGVRARF